ncbi:MAG: hypothetical protein C0469_06575 [Cyanobacteria bacterium DS2.3.42]|nr:hypothetical protein [Cyanobacteria bacterium DS2.3.42]
MENYIDSLSRWTDVDLYQRADAIRGWPSLVLYGRAVSDYGIKVLEGCHNLKELHLVETSVTDKGLASLANLRSLKWLSIDTADVTDSGIMQLKNLNQLEGLQLVKTGCSDDGLAILLNLPHLEYLEISGCTIAEKGALYISRVSSLNSLRLAAPTIFDDAFLGLAYCKKLSKFSFDMPLVSPEAIHEMRLRLPNCELDEYCFFRPEDKVIYLVTNFFGNGKTLANFADALSCTDELLTYSPFHPALHGARALLNYRMGNFEAFRDDLRNTRDNANLCGQRDVQQMATSYLAENTLFGLRMLMQSHNPDRFIANKLLTAGVRPTVRKEPITDLINKLKNMTYVPTDPYHRRIAPPPLNEEQWTTPNYRQPTTTIDLSKTHNRENQSSLILPKKLKDELQAVPWNW